MTPGVLPAFITSGLIILVTGMMIVNCTNELYSKRLDPALQRYVPNFTSTRANQFRTLLRHVANFLLAEYILISFLFLAHHLPKLSPPSQPQSSGAKLGDFINEALIDQFVIVMFAVSILIATVILRWYIFVRRREF